MNGNKLNKMDETEWNRSAKRCLDACGKLLAWIDNAKTAIVAEFRDKVAGQAHMVELAVNEAEALAWQTDFPQLFFPALAVEKASAVAAWNARQQALRRERTAFALAA